MAATSPAIGNPQRCSNGAAARTRRCCDTRCVFWFPGKQPAASDKGFQDTAYDEAARAHNLRGQSAELAPLLHELTLYCTEPPMDSGHITAPVYVYLGLQDDVLSSVNPDDWYSAYPNADVTVRTYPDGGHDVQYRHLDQILLDISGQGDRILVCENGQQRMIDPSEATARPPHLDCAPGKTETAFRSGLAAPPQRRCLRQARRLLRQITVKC